MFKKGNISWNKGIAMPKEHNGIFKKGYIPWNKGKTFSEKTKEKMSKARLGKSPYNKGKKGLQISWNKGIACPKIRGSNNPNWKGGISSLNDLVRKSLNYKIWHKAIFERDNFTCQVCRQYGGKLVTHHINNFADFPELRLAIDNGIILCEKCHKEFHKIFGKKNNTKEQLESFLIN